MITLMTGLPGHGKTQFALESIRAKAKKENRQVYYYGIKDLKIDDWLLMDDPHQWLSLPDGSIILIDECQRVFPNRPTGSRVPDHVQYFDTHRHKGYDVILITQDPGLLDSFIRKLVGEHFHTIRKFGGNSANVYRWESLHDGSKRSDRADACEKIAYSFKKDIWALYPSATIHTVQRNIPKKIWLYLPLAIIVAVGSIFLSVKFLMGLGRPPAVSPVSVVSSGSVGSTVSNSDKGRIKTSSEYIESLKPRVPGLPHTASFYDDAAHIYSMPFPVACIANSRQCQCFTDQGTRIHGMDEVSCRTIVDTGIYNPFRVVSDHLQQSAQDKPASG